MHTALSVTFLIIGVPGADGNAAVSGMRLAANGALSGPKFRVMYRIK